MRKIKFCLVIFLIAMPCLVNAADAQLLLVRNAESNTTCDTPVFHGKLYSVPESQRLDDVATALGLDMLTQTQELPFEDNASDRSSIPTGTYTARIRTEQTKTWMQGKPNRAWRLELNEVKHRSAIQFHFGKDKSWSNGCIILTGNSNSDGLICRSEDPDSPEGAVIAVRNYVEKQLNKSSDKILIRIVEWPQ